MRCPFRSSTVAALLLAAAASRLVAGVGDPQVRTDHSWYPGELACSTFERLQATQADLYERVTGIRPATDHHRALAAWLWRNTHYWHGEEGKEDLWDAGFGQGGDGTTREYWTGLFAHGFGLCGTTHAQWSAEMQALLGHNRGRSLGVTGHNSFEVFLTGGPYGDGRWALLDHDVSTILIDDRDERLLSIRELKTDLSRLKTNRQTPGGWLACGLHPDDGAAFDSYRTAEYLAGFSGPPPIVHLRRGERLRRYLQPGLDDGKTFVFWGRNYKTADIPGPERSRTWVNQPETMHASQDGAGYRPGQARYANAVYSYAPDLAGGDYREAVVDESANHVVLEFHTPYIIAATPPDDSPWGIYKPGCTNGLVISGRAACDVSISTDRGTTWTDGRRLDGQLDLTDAAKGHRQYWLQFGTGAENLHDGEIKIVTVCQCNASIIPRLTDDGCDVQYESTGRAIVSAGPNRDQARAHLVDGAFGTPRVTLELATPRGERAVALYAAAHVQSSNPPSPDVAYRIEASTDGGRTWQPVVHNWRITRRGDEPPDFWSQSFCYGSLALSGIEGPVRVRFANDGGKRYSRAELHLAYEPHPADAAEVTFCWREGNETRQAAHVFPPRSQPGSQADTQQTDPPAPWTVPTGSDVETLWVEYAAMPVE